MATNVNTVIRKCYGIKVIEEYESSGVALIPGMVAELTSTANYIQAHATSSGNAYPLIVFEDELQGVSVDTAYTAYPGTKVQTWMPQRGDEANLILVDGQSVVRGDRLESNGAGYLQKYVADVDAAHDSDDADPATTIYTTPILCIALEAMDLSGSSGEETSGNLGYNKRIAVKFV